MYSHFPGLTPAQIDYATWVGLYLNIERVDYQRAIPVLRGVSAASGNDILPIGWFDALSRWECEAKALSIGTNQSRLHAELLATGGKGGP